jgi:sugar lactone lactonase YvrE
MTYNVSSTESGAFDRQPDQVARLLGENTTNVLYFCEDGGSHYPNGVHARDSMGKYYTILHAINAIDFYGETSGLAFSPGNERMYVSSQGRGEIYEIRREDGYPFGGQRLDIKYHSDDA